MRFCLCIKLRISLSTYLIASQQWHFIKSSQSDQISVALSLGVLSELCFFAVLLHFESIIVTGK